MTDMLRYDRPRYIALGLPTLANAVLIPLYGLQISTGGSQDEFALPLYITIAIASGLFGVTAMIKRTRDIGASVWGILLGFMFAPPLMLVIALVLALIPTNPEADALEPASPAVGFDIWFKGLILLLLPWLLVLLVRAW